MSDKQDDFLEAMPGIVNTDGWVPLRYEFGHVIGQAKITDGRVEAVIDDPTFLAALQFDNKSYSIQNKEKLMSDVTTGGEPAGQPQEPVFPQAPLESPEDVPRLVDSGSLTRAEIEKRFGFHKATIEGPNPSRQQHAELRLAFQNWAGFLSLNIPASREASLMFTALEEASMWAHKAVAADDEIEKEA